MAELRGCLCSFVGLAGRKADQSQPTVQSPGVPVDSDEGRPEKPSLLHRIKGISAHLPHTWLEAQSSPEGGAQSRKKKGDLLEPK